MGFLLKNIVSQLFAVNIKEHRITQNMPLCAKTVKLKRGKKKGGGGGMPFRVKKMFFFKSL